LVSAYLFPVMGKTSIFLYQIYKNQHFI